MAIVVGDLADGRIALTDVGTGAIVGGLIGETIVRLASALGHEWQADGWREGMFVGALFVLALWLFREVGA